MTHSILDILMVSNTPYDQRSDGDFLTAFVMPASWLREMYGTFRPSRQMVEKAVAEGPGQFESLERGTAVYHEVWENKDDPGSPKWWFYYGCTGD